MRGYQVVSLWCEVVMHKLSIVLFFKLKFNDDNIGYIFINKYYTNLLLNYKYFMVL